MSLPSPIPDSRPESRPGAPAAASGHASPGHRVSHASPGHRGGHASPRHRGGPSRQSRQSRQSRSRDWRTWTAGWCGRIGLLLLVWLGPPVVDYSWRPAGIVTGCIGTACMGTGGVRAGGDGRRAGCVWADERPGGLAQVSPESVGMDPDHLRRIDPLVERAIQAGETPGCVVAVGRRGRLVWLKAYGQRQQEPAAEPMTVDTVFDLASLTKPVCTASCILLLVERGELRLESRVARALPEFAAEGKEGLTVRQLLTHQAGLIADNPLADYEQGADAAWRNIWALRPVAEPESRFIYSDVGFIVLGKLVERVSGQGLDQFARRNLFEPLGMADTAFVLDAAARQRAAATAQRDGRWLKGEVHDPRAFHLGGVAGHAGLFSTAGDLAVYAQMLLDGGRYRNTRIFSPATVRLMTADYPVPSGVGESPRGIRGLGWDKRTGYSTNRGDLLSADAFGHGGFTGTSLWIDPRSELFVVFLGSRLHPDGRGLVNPLAGRIANVAAGAIR